MKRVVMLETTVNKNGNTVFLKKSHHGRTYYTIIFDTGYFEEISDDILRMNLKGEIENYDVLNAKLTSDEKIVLKDMKSEAVQKRLVEEAIRTYTTVKNPVILNAFGPYICDNEEVAFLAIQKCGANFEYCSDRLKNKLDFVKRVIPYFPEAYLCVSPELKRNKELIWQSLMRNKDMHLRFVIEDIPHELYMDKGYMTQLIKKVIENNRIDVLQCLLLNIPDQMYMNNPDFCVEVVKIASTNKNTLLCMLGGIVQGKSITNIHTYNF